ncbi:MAG TPA: TonB family protein [Pyrinomonadaceae bacterium]|nr:TonB family protein [Pyrinomonadaceae bacterium]
MLSQTSLLLSLSLLAAGAAHSAAQTGAPDLPPPEAARAGAAQTGVDGLNARVIALAEEGKYTEALPLAEQVLQLRTTAHGREHVSTADAHQNLGIIHQRLGNRGRAESHYRRALSVYEKGDEAAKVKATVVLDNLALLSDTPAAGVSLHERSLAFKESLFGPDSPEVSMSLFPLAHLHELQGGEEKAERLFRRFLEVRERMPFGSPDDAGVALFRLECLARKRGRGREAADFAARAEEVFRSAAQGRDTLSREDVIDGKIVSRPPPSYPAEARRTRESGVVPVRVLVGETGTVLAACGESRSRALNLAAERAAYNARFSPTLVGGQPVKVRGVITYRFVAR